MKAHLQHINYIHYSLNIYVRVIKRYVGGRMTVHPYLVYENYTWLPINTLVVIGVLYRPPVLYRSPRESSVHCLFRSSYSNVRLHSTSTDRIKPAHAHVLHIPSVFCSPSCPWQSLVQWVRTITDYPPCLKSARGYRTIAAFVHAQGCGLYSVNIMVVRCISWL